MMTDRRDHDGMICVIMMARRPHGGRDMPLLTPEEAGERLRLAPRTIREMVRIGRLSGVLLGRLIRVREEDILHIEQFGMGDGEPLTVPGGHIVVSRFVSAQAERPGEHRSLER